MGYRTENAKTGKRENEIEKELKIKARPVHGVQLWGYLDGLIELEGGGYAILDLKSTQNTKWVIKKTPKEFPFLQIWG